MLPVFNTNLSAAKNEKNDENPTCAVFAWSALQK